MAFSGFASLGNNTLGAGGSTGATAQGSDLEIIQTEALGFLTLAGDAKLRLTSPWSPIPAPTASLLSIASRKGLVAAAGPDAVIVASTESVRKAFENPPQGDSDVRVFQPQLKLSLPIRICQLAFTTDENYLILSAEQGGGLAVYEVQALQQGSQQTAFEIPTNGESLRALVPNPQAEKGELCAVVTNAGKLLMANVKERDFVPGRNGQVLREQVSCVSWSTKGKQLVAGLGDGTIVQMTPEGDVKAEIPRAPGLDANHFVEFVVWLENDLFLACHVSATEQPPTTKCHIITRQGPNFQFQALTNPVDPFGSDKSPHHTVARLKDFPPNLQDLLIFSSTAFSDIGLASRSKKALTSDMPAEKITNVFTTTELADDSRRATLPMGDGMESPVPIGTALDLSGKDKVYKPIPTDEQDESPGPLPGYWALNDEGVLSAWWVVYSDSIRGGTTYPGLAAVESNTPGAAPAPQQAQSNPFSSTTTSAFGAPAQAPKPAFGGPSSLGIKASPWATTASTGGSAFGSSVLTPGAATSAPAFGKPSFGVPSAPSFGQSSGIGTKSSPWATTAASSSGQSTFANATSGSANPFGSSAANSNPPSSGGFASFANKGGFGQVGSNTSASGPSIFASASKTEAPEVSMDSDSGSAFLPSSSRPNTGSGNPFGSSPFKLGSTFQRDPNANDDDVKADEGSGGGNSMFGSKFGSVLGETAQSPKPNPFASATKSVFGQPNGPSSANSTTPTSTPAPNKFFSQLSEAPKSSGIFGAPSKDSTTPTSSFVSMTAQTPADPVPIKAEAETPKPLRDIPDAPLPPESTSKATFPLGDSSSSSASSAGQSENSLSKANEAPLPPDSPPAADGDAPLPPDPIQNKKVYDVKIPPLPETISKAESSDDAPLPPDPIKNKKVYDVEIPPVPGQVATSKPTADAPLPPDPIKQSKAYDVKFPTIPDTKSPASSVLPGPKVSDKPFVFPSNPPPVLTDSDDDDDDGGDEESGEESEGQSEGSGVDVAKDLSPTITGINKTPGFTPGSSFDGLASSFSSVSHPDQGRRGLFGEISRNAPVFAQPNVVSPRSPSPVRNALPSKLLGKEQSRSFSTPAMASGLLGAARRQGGHGSTMTGKAAAVAEDHIIEQQRKAKAKKQAEESRLLVDEEDVAIHQILRSGIEPKLVLDEFIAHSGAVAPAGDSIPAQVEAVHRDINSMIDTLGLNARSLSAFIKGHEQVSEHDLASPDDWVLGDIKRLTHLIEHDLNKDLRDAAVSGVDDKLARCAELQRELARDRNKQADLKKIIASRLDPDQAVANRALPLTAEQAAQQTDLRREHARFAKLLAEAEENLTLLKARIVSAGGSAIGGGDGAGGGERAGGGGKVGVGGPAPTIEAVVRTITKMTSMVEKRSGDIDVLETQMRKLRLGSAGAGAGSRESSPFLSSSVSGGGPPVTPQSKRMSASMLFSPERSMRESSRTPQQPNRNFRHSHSLSGSVNLGGSVSGTPLRTPPRKKLTAGGGFGEVEKAAVKEKRGRRALVLGKLRTSLQNKGVSVWAVEEGE